MDANFLNEPGKKMGPTEMQAEVERLQAAGKLPPLEDVLSTVAAIRKEYAPQILEARQKGETDAKNGE